jgi:hypothetical protein
MRGNEKNIFLQMNDMFSIHLNFSLKLWITSTFVANCGNIFQMNLYISKTKLNSRQTCQVQPLFVQILSIICHTSLDKMCVPKLK